MTGACVAAKIRSRILRRNLKQNAECRKNEHAGHRAERRLTPPLLKAFRLATTYIALRSPAPERSSDLKRYSPDIPISILVLPRHTVIRAL